MIRLAAGLALAAAIASTATAQQPKIDCRKVEANVELTWCAEQEFQRADRELNRLFPLALASIDRQDHLTKEQRDKWKAALREAQRNWARFKDIDCGEVIGYEWSGGSGMGLASYGCLREKTQARIAELRERYALK